MYVHLFIWGHMSVCMYAHECSETWGDEKVIWVGLSSGGIYLGCFVLFKTGSFFLGLGLADYSKLAYLLTLVSL